tara:strand:- start:3785 stop:4870 length:1086 start_codon:yes stop_codon:yes gene_type:complete
MAEDILNKSQKELIINEWNSRPDNPPSLLELINIAFPDQGLDGRTKEGRAVKAFLASRDIKARASHEYQSKKEIKLSEEDKLFIQNNLEFMSSVEMGRLIFKDNNLTNLNQEVRVIADYVKELTSSDQSVPFEPTEEIPAEEYKPPKTFDKTMYRVNKYVPDAINKEKITSKDKKNVKALIGYLNAYRFSYQMNTYTNNTDRDLFESSFIRYTHNKDDLSQEEVDQYIVLSSEVVIAANIQRRKEHLTRLLDNLVEDSDGRASMSLVEAIGKTETEYNQSVNRQQKLLESLKEKRSDRLKKQIKENASILNLVRLWKEEESRQNLLHLAEMRKKTVGEEVQKLSDIDEVKARILGLGEDDV